MFEVFQVFFGVAIAALSLLLGLGLLLGGLLRKARFITVIGVVFIFVGVAWVLLVWAYTIKADRDHIRDAEARGRAAQETTVPLNTIAPPKTMPC